MRFKSLLLGSFLIAPALAAAPASAQPTPPPLPQGPPPISSERVAPERPLAPGGQALQGSIQVCEAARGEHRITMQQGRRYTITATSDAFDTMLRVFRPGSLETPAAENDDGPEMGLNSRVNYTAPESGEYIVRVSSFAPGGVGNYNLRVEPAAPLPPLMTRASRTERGQWRIYEGSLSASDPADNGRHYRDYELRMTAGQGAMIHLTGEGMDPLLRVYRADGRGGEALAENDDGGGGTNSFVYFAPEEAGTYVVRVTTFGEDGTGSYRLRISQ